MRETLTILVLLAAFAAPVAAAQDDPSVNESEMDTTPPPSDESYLDDAETENGVEPSLAESDMDTSSPDGDESYLDDAEAELAASDGTSGGDDAGTSKDTPAAPLALALPGIAAAALLLRRR